MASPTTITSPQVRDGEISRADLNSTISGRAVIKKVVQGTGGISISSSGADAGTGDSTISLNPFVGSGASHAAGGVPDPGATPGTTKFLREDGTFAVPGAAVDPFAAYSQDYGLITTAVDLSADWNVIGTPTLGADYNYGGII